MSAEALSVALTRAQEAQEAVLRAEEALRVAHEARDAAAVALVRGDGLTYREAGSLLGISHARVGQLVKADRLQGWGPPILRPLEDAATRLDAYRAAKHAQVLREEAVTMGYETERRAFYGDPGVAASDSAETALTFRAWLEGSRQEGTA